MRRATCKGRQARRTQDAGLFRLILSTSGSDWHPGPHLDEVPIAFVELHENDTVTQEELIQFCRGRIANYKVPRGVAFVTEGSWPMSATKVDKRALRELATTMFSR